MYAKEYVGETNYLRYKILVNFNEWASNENYRKKLSSKLKVPFTDSTKEMIPGFGYGSSFDKHTFQGKANQMKVNRRWPKFCKSNLFKYIFSNTELLRLAKKIYPFVYSDYSSYK